MNHPVCKNIPIILEPPAYETEQEEVELLKLVTKWNSSKKK
jgi:endonuclease IV